MSVEEQAAEYAAKVIENKQWPITVKLRYPVEFGKDNTITQLEFRRGRFGDLKGIKADSMPSDEQMMLIASRMCAQPIKVLEMLDMEDVSEVREIVLGFFVKSLGAGKTG